MSNVSATVLVGLAAWTLFLLILMETLRTRLILTKAIAANAFKPDNSNLSPFMQRLARAHANCVESLPVFGVLLIVALLTNRAGVTNPLAPWLLAARLVQSCAHLASLKRARRLRPVYCLRRPNSNCRLLVMGIAPELAMAAIGAKQKFKLRR
jgi:uncharacterized MAPEG superfamily protein